MPKRIIDATESQVPVPAAPAVRPGALAHVTADPMSLLAGAVERGMLVEIIERLAKLAEHMQNRAAEKEFDEAMAAFKAECPPIPRRTENAQFFVTRNGVKRPRMYAALEDIEATIREPLGRHGLSFRWGDSKIENGMLTLACIVSHRGGHSKSSIATMPLESRAGCSEQQKFGAARTYARRDSLVDALGLTTCDEDSDGKPDELREPIDEKQVATLDAMLVEMGASDERRAKFLAFMGAERLSAIPKSRYAEAVAALKKAGAKK